MNVERPDRILVIRRGDYRLAIPLLDAVDPTPLGILVSALPTMLMHLLQAPEGADVGPPLADDSSVLMLRVAGAEDPLVPDVGLLAQTEGKWQAGGPAEGGRTDATARVPELEVDLVDVERPVIALRGADLDLTVRQDQPAGAVDLTVERVPVGDTGIGIAAGYSSDRELIEVADAERAALPPEARAVLERAERELERRVILGDEVAEEPASEAQTGA